MENFGISYGYLVCFMDIYVICFMDILYILWLFGIFFLVWAYCSKKNLATLASFQFLANLP
jgi:hypothetical protein